jgi:hypothetical protein
LKNSLLLSLFIILIWNVSYQASVKFINENNNNKLRFVFNY